MSIQYADNSNNEQANNNNLNNIKYQLKGWIPLCNNYIAINQRIQVKLFLI